MTQRSDRLVELWQRDFSLVFALFTFILWLERARSAASRRTRGRVEDVAPGSA